VAISLKSNAAGTLNTGTFGTSPRAFRIMFDITLTWLVRYIADYVFALSTIAFFMTAIGMFILAHFISSHILGYRRFRGPAVWRKLIASVRYLSYRGFHIRALRWNSAPIGILLLGLAGTVFFFCRR
jgi:hypothetical protein